MVRLVDEYMVRLACIEGIDRNFRTVDYTKHVQCCITWMQTWSALEIYMVRLLESNKQRISPDIIRQMVLMHRQSPAPSEINKEICLLVCSELHLDHWKFLLGSVSTQYLSTCRSCLMVGLLTIPQYI